MVHLYISTNTRIFQFFGQIIMASDMVLIIFCLHYIVHYLLSQMVWSLTCLMLTVSFSRAILLKPFMWPIPLLHWSTHPNYVCKFQWSLSLVLNKSGEHGLCISPTFSFALGSMHLDLTPLNLFPHNSDDVWICILVYICWCDIDPWHQQYSLRTPWIFEI